MLVVFYFVALFFLVPVTFNGISFFLRTLFANETKYKEVQELYVRDGEGWFAGFKRAISGTIVEHSELGREHLISAGLALKDGKYFSQAKLSREAIRSLLEPN